jgi:CubicO group peptidase (beta-lactamase class C family)
VGGVLVGALIAATVGCGQEHVAAGVWANLEQARTYLDTAANETGFSGVVLIGRGEEVVFEEAYGLADVDLRVPMSTDHRFRIGSLTKPITASAVLVAVDRGLLALDQHVCRMLPSCPESWESVTVRHLLTHTSGIADHFGDLESVPVEATARELRRVLESLPPDEKLRAPPGAEYAYSNFNYVLLGVVLEQVVGAPWETTLRQLVLEPVGLRAMAYDDVYAIMEDRVRGYERDDELGLRNIDYDELTCSGRFLWSFIPLRRRCR